MAKDRQYERELSKELTRRESAQSLSADSTFLPVPGGLGSGSLEGGEVAAGGAVQTTKPPLGEGWRDYATTSGPPPPPLGLTGGVWPPVGMDARAAFHAGVEAEMEVSLLGQGYT